MASAVAAPKLIDNHTARMERYVYLWNIEGIGLHLKTQWTIPIQKTVFMRRGDLQWSLAFYLKRFRSQERSNDSSIYQPYHRQFYTRLEAKLVKSSLAEEVEGRFSILDEDNHKVLPGSSFQTSQDGVIRMDTDLEDEEVLLKAASNDTLKLLVEVNVTVPVPTTSESHHAESLQLQKQACVQELTAKTRESADTVVSAGKSVFPVHSCLMSRASPVFQAMLEKDARNTLKTVKIVDFLDNILIILVNFMYTREVPVFENLDSGTIVKILEAACKYEVTGLKRLAADYLVSNLESCDVMNVLLMAYEYHIPLLKEKAMNFICENRDQFSSFSDYTYLEGKSDLLTEILVKSFSLEKSE